MSILLNGFTDELVKEALIGAGVAKRVGKTLFKNPNRAILSLMGAGVLASTAMAARAGYKSGLRGGEEGRYLRASRRGPSRAAYTNYHPMFKHKPSAKQVRRLSKHYKPGAFSGSSVAEKAKKKKKKD